MILITLTVKLNYTILQIIKGSFTDNKIEIRVEPASRDVDAVRELYLDVDISKSNFSAVPE